MRAGLHVLVEKPLDVSITQAGELIRTAKESGCVFAVMLNQRTSPLFQRAREIVQGGLLGELKRSVWIVTNWYRTQHYYVAGRGRRRPSESGAPQSGSVAMDLRNARFGDGLLQRGKVSPD